MTIYELTVDSSVQAAIERIVKENLGEDTTIEIIHPPGGKYYITIEAEIPTATLLTIRDEILYIIESRKMIGSFKVL